MKFLAALGRYMEAHIVPNVAAAARQYGIPRATAYRILSDPRARIRLVLSFPALGLKPVFVVARGGGSFERARELAYMKFSAPAYPGNLALVMHVHPTSLVEECVEGGERLVGSVAECWALDRALVPRPRPELLERLGFRRVAVVKKVREVYRVGPFEVTLDSVEGLGDFVEIELKEGASSLEEAEEKVLALARELGIEEEPIKQSYLELILGEQ